MNELQIARVAHEVNRAYCLALGDYSPLAWEDAPDWTKESVMNGVEYLRDAPRATPAGAHANWMSRKAAAGWTYHAEKNVEKKRHPCMLPFDKLPLEQQAKDFIFLGVVRALLEVQ